MALSGGPDSCALLLALMEAADAGLLPRPVGAAHFHHGLRGTDADEDAAFSAALATRLGLPCVVGIGAVPTGEGLSPNDAARRARYAFLTEAAGDLQADTIATAHTMDDQAETVLLRVLRGTGTDGLAGIPATRELEGGLTAVRPLLSVRRVDIEAYCRERGVTPRYDPSNTKDRYARSRLRARLPQIAQDFNPRLPDALSRLADNAARDADLLNQLTDELWKRACLRDEETLVVLDKAPLYKTHSALRRRVLLRAIRAVAGEDASASRAGSDFFVTLLEGWLASSVDTAADLPGGINACTSEAELTLARKPKEEGEAVGYETILTIPGQTTIPGTNLTVETTWRDPDAEIVRARRSYTIDIGIATEEEPLLKIRTARVGDRIAPLGMGGKTRLVRDILAEAGIPEAERDSVPVVVSVENGEVWWLVGFVQSEKTRVLPHSERVLRLSVACP